MNSILEDEVLQETKRLKALNKDLVNWSQEIEKKEVELYELRDSLECREFTVDDRIEKLKKAETQMRAINKPVIDLINEVILMLELEADKDEILKMAIEKRKAFDINW